MTPQPGRHHTGIPQQAVPLQCCEYASRPLGLHYTRGDALADCRYCLPDVRGQPGSYRHLWHPQGVPACHSEWGALRWLHTPHPSLADTTQASHNRQCHCSAVSRPQGLLACTTLELMHSQTVDPAGLMSEVSLGHIDTRGTRRVCLHASLTGAHLGVFTHDTPAWQTPLRHPTTGSATAVL